MTQAISKPLGHDDISAFEFTKEMLMGDMTGGINIERIQHHPKYGYMIFEYQLCSVNQKYVDPHTSHPNKYWDKCHRKYMRLWAITTKLGGTLFVVNYAKKDTEHENKVKVMTVQKASIEGLLVGRRWNMTRAEFSVWFRRWNAECLVEL